MVVEFVELLVFEDAVLVDFVGAGWAGEFLVCDGVSVTGVSTGWGVFCADAIAILSCGGV